MFYLRILAVVFSAVLSINSLSGCKGTPTYNVKENITDSETVIDSDWSAKDLKRVASEMADSVEDARFIRSSKYKSTNPRWMLSAHMKNDTDEHINTRVIMEKVRTKLVNRGIARFIDDQAVDAAIEQLHMQQSALYDENKVAEIGKFIGAKLILRGRVSSIRKKRDNVDIIYYNLTFQAVDIETLDIVWTDETEIQRKTTKS